MSRKQAFFFLGKGVRMSSDELKHYGCACVFLQIRVNQQVRILGSKTLRWLVSSEDDTLDYFCW